jgi:ubiquitin-like 1-activating enzyme E1 B
MNNAYLEMAGNIIPAIATTNAIVAGVIVLQALHLLRRTSATRSVKAPSDSMPNSLVNSLAQSNVMHVLRNMNIQSKPAVPLSASRVVPPSHGCVVCQDTYTSVQCDTGRTTLGELVNGILGTGNNYSHGTGPRDVSVYEGARVLADPDFDDNMDSTLESLSVTRGKFLTIVDEDENWGNLSIALCELK